MGKIYAAKTNHITNPLGFYMEQIVFSWKVKECKGKKQKNARILISEKEDFSEILLDTKEENLDSCGTKVDLQTEPYTRYYWKVIVATDQEEVVESDVQFFETAKQDEPWVGKWITCGWKEGRHPIFSKPVSTEKEVERARLYICGLGLYEAYFTSNKTEKTEKIGKEYLTPYCNNYDQWIQYQTYDVTEQMKAGGELSVLLGDGWYKGRFGFSQPEKKGFFGDAWKVIAEVHIDYADGSKEVIGTDESWKVTESKISFSNIYDGEKRDDTLPDVPKAAAILAVAPKGRLMERLSLPVTVYKEMKPVELIHTPAGEQVFDLGQEITGIFRFHVKEAAGTEILIQTGEVLQDGNFYNGNLRTAKSEYHYISDGTEKEFIPYFTYYGYRYVKVSGVTDLSCDDFTALVLCSEYEKTGELETGHELVNQLISNVEWGMRGNFLDVPTDCPQRDERMGWTGDTQVFSVTASYLADTYAFYRKFLYDMYQEQLLADGMVPEVVPTFGPSKTSCAWGDAACILPWNVYLFSGDKTILEQQIDSMKAWVDYIRRVDGEHHGWRNSFHYGDWLALDRPGAKEGNVYGVTDEAYIADVYYAASAQIVAKAAEALGKSELQKEYQEIADQQWTVVRDEYFTATGRCAIKTQTGLTLALKYHLSENETMTAEMLKKLFRQNKYKLNTGFVGTPLLCNVLTENGMSDIAYQLLLNEEFPGWLYEVKLGATTVWERWNSLDENGHVSSTGMNSLNHYSYGAVLEWVYRHAAGIDVTEQNPGGRKMKIHPKVNAELGYVDVSWDSASGRYQSSWKILDGNKIQLRFSVPFGCEAEISLPYVADSVYEEKENPLFVNVKEGVCLVEAGNYEVTYEAVVPLKKTYSVDSTMEDLMSNPKIRGFLASMMDVDMLPDIVYEMSLRDVAKMFAGEIGDEQEKMLNAALGQF